MTVETRKIIRLQQMWKFNFSFARENKTKFIFNNFLTNAEKFILLRLDRLSKVNYTTNSMIH